jgi:hypothetical protein
MELYEVITKIEWLQSAYKGFTLSSFTQSDINIINRTLKMWGVKAASLKSKYSIDKKTMMLLDNNKSYYNSIRDSYNKEFSGLSREGYLIVSVL